MVCRLNNSASLGLCQEGDLFALDKVGQECDRILPKNQNPRLSDIDDETLTHTIVQ